MIIFLIIDFIFFFKLGILSLIITIELTDTLFNVIVIVLIPIPSLINPVLLVYSFIGENIKQKKAKELRKKNELVANVVLKQRKMC